MPGSFAFLCLKEHPYGREMLKQLLDAGQKPLIVIEEDGGPRADGRVSVATEEREKFLERCKGHVIQSTIKEQCAANGIELVEVPQHNKEACQEHIARVKPDLLVLGGTRIIRVPVLTMPKDGVLNAHPGLLPECRGSASPAWSVKHDIPIGSTCHFCSPEIDEGDIVGRREIPVKKGMTYEDLCYYTMCMSGTLMTEAVLKYQAGTITECRVKQGASDNPTFKNAPDEVIEEVRQKLADGTYKHMVQD
ncbi:Methionyl-tRNA formyltransferase [Diplonema papillatum]|nr:Methionyl-tRNA formyltransferase [Diplonema papillatum]